MNTPTLTEYQSAERELVTREAHAGFRNHATVYAVVIPILALINILAVPEFFWFEFPMLGWGLGLLLHYRLGVRGAAEQATRHQALVTMAAARS
jgi:hypothetical protein